MVVGAEHVSKRYGDFLAVEDIGFSIKRGSCFGLLGPNGAGKSTMIKMIYGAISRSEGKLSVLGLDPQTQHRTLRRRLGVVTQDNSLDEEMSVRENMLLFGGFLGVPRAELVPRVDELLDFMELSHKANERIQALSGGMKRRLVFVRALVGKPKLLILDEPTTGLDPAVRHLLWAKVDQLRRSGTTILLTTHYMEEAQHLCDELVIVDRGRVRSLGSPRELIREHGIGYVALFEGESGLSRIEEASLDALTRRIKEMGREPVLMRPGNLEDVFLKLTGRELTENA